MTELAVKSLCGLGEIPTDRTSATKWLTRKIIPTFKKPVNGGDAEFVQLSDLPAKERLAYLQRELDALQIDPGEYDDVAHMHFLALTPQKRARAENKAAVTRAWVALKAQGISESERVSAIEKRFGKRGHSEAALKRWANAVKGIDPINFAPALVDGYKATKKRVPMSEDAWRLFMTLIRDGGKDWPLKCAWRDVRDIGKERDWDVPSWSTFYRRWIELTEAQRLVARHGREEAVKRLTQPALRDKTTLAALEMVSLDG